ncbi:MAG: electron transfer flavoprotein subunit beta/FixA family protein [Desulfurococcales archaeon]|nr:electron transfer flavoprotein subunit beta/FixA family protein [Desulfurococcales archaeon]
MAGYRVVVGIKWVPNTQAVRFDPKTGTLIRQGVPAIINPQDLHAIEMALRLRDAYGGEVIVITMAPPPAVQGLEHAIGMGADRAILVTDRSFAGADTLATSYVLARAINKVEREIGRVDLAVFGQETIDSSTAHIGAQVASWLGWPYIYYVKQASLSNGSLRVVRQLEDVIEEYEAKLPAVISVLAKALRPRHVSLLNKLRARTERPIITWTNKDLGLDTRCVGLKGSPTIVAKVTYLPEVPRLKKVHKAENPREAARWLLKNLLSDEKTRDLIARALWGEGSA